MVKEQFKKSAGWEICEMTWEDAISVRFVVSSEWGKHAVRCVFAEMSLRRWIMSISHAHTLQEWGKKPTAGPYADGQMSLPSA
jgi:hypothetical protein